LAIIAGPSPVIPNVSFHGTAMNDTTKKFDLSKPDKSIIFVPCGICKNQTRHEIITSYCESGSEDCGQGASVDWEDKNETLQCLGCENVLFRKVHTFSEDVEYDGNDLYIPERITYYPSIKDMPESVNENDIPVSIRAIYHETIQCLANEQLILAGVGIRAIIETICKDLKAKGNGLHEKINDLKTKSIVTNDGAETLHKLRIIGNDAAHDVKAHDSKMLSLAMRIVNHMIEGTYIIPKKIHEHFPGKS